MSHILNESKINDSNNLDLKNQSKSKLLSFNIISPISSKNRQKYSIYLLKLKEVNNPLII